ncbi:MAG TPA: protein translocase subunit SecD, partial [Armatimonadota bacterium]|nr:protein translocase subunit SecD [Armatimonadota bacterium]
MKQGLTFLALLVLAIAAGWYALSPQYPVSKGLDLQGGMRVTLEPDYNNPRIKGQAIDEEKMNTVRDVLESRVNNFGLSGTEVRLKATSEGKQQVLVVLPGVKEPEKALNTLSTVAQLEFRHLNNVQSNRNTGARFRMNVTPGNAEKGEADKYTFTDVQTNKVVEETEVPEQVIKDAPLILTGDYLKPTSEAVIDPTKGQPTVTFELNGEGAERFATFTQENVGEILAVVLDNKIISAPNIQTPITEGSGVITGSATMTEARLLANLLKSGALPIPMVPTATQFVGATLGQESVNRSIMAGLIGLGLVLLFMLAYYWLPGLVACIALLMYSAITFSIFKGVRFAGQPEYFLPPIVLDLPGITGFILSVGMAVDANVLIFERLKEELRAGKSLHAAIDAGFQRAFSSILDSNVTTWIVCGVLIWLGSPIIKGFAITLAIGVAVSMFSAITVTRTILHLIVAMPWARNAGLYALNVSWLGLLFPASRRGGILRVFEKRGLYLGLSALLGLAALVLTAASFFGYGLKPGIDFTGGSVMEVACRNKEVTREQVVKVAEESGIRDATVSIARSETPWTRVTVEATDVNPLSQAKVKERLAALTDRGYDPQGYSQTVEGKTFKAAAVYTNPVAEADLRAALNRKATADDVALNLTGLRITTTVEPHQGANAIPVALIQSRALQPQQVSDLKEKLGAVGGGVVEPMYQQSSIGPSVARDVTTNAFFSVVVASLGIILYLAFRFAIGGFMNGLKFGVCAVIALVHDVGIVIGIFALMGALAGWQVDSLFVTAALTILGFSVHDTIVVYDRIRENLHNRGKGETFAEVSDRSITQSFDRSINTTLTVLLVVAALVFF